jgi:hypothetical protein
VTDWDRVWRGSGVVFAVLIIIAFVIAGLRSDKPGTA